MQFKRIVVNLANIVNIVLKWIVGNIMYHQQNNGIFCNICMCRETFLIQKNIVAAETVI